MSLSNFISKLNWLLILVHVLACWFVRYALVELADYSLFYQPSNVLDGPEWIYGSRLWEVVRYTAPAITFILSSLVSHKQKWYWMNSLLVFLITFIICQNDLLMWYELRVFFGLITLDIDSVSIRHFIQGLIMLGIALCLFFLKSIVKFIDGDKQARATQ